MPKLIPSAERIKRARLLIQKAREIPVALPAGKYDLSYIAQVKDTLRQAVDLVKFIPDQPTATPEMKEEVQAIKDEAKQTERELLR